MSRHLNQSRVDELREQSSPHALVGFLTIRHWSLVEHIRVVSDPIDFVVDGDTYIACPFQFQLLTDEDSHPTASLRVQNVDRRIGEAILALPDRAIIRLDVRSLSEFDLSQRPRVRTGTLLPPLYSFDHFELTEVTANPIEITGTPMLRDYTQEPYPGKRATQSRCPGLYR